MFSKDRFHPSAAGYGRAASAILPSVASALGLWPEADRPLEPRRGEGVGPLHVAAVHAVDHPGTEVSPDPQDEPPGGGRAGALAARTRRTRQVVLRRLRRAEPPAASADGPSEDAIPASTDPVVSTPGGASPGPAV